MKTAHKKSALIIGASRGIGMEWVRQLATENSLGVGLVFATTRKATPEIQKIGAREITGIDVANPASYSKLEKVLEGNQLDYVIHNAGIFETESFGKLEAETLLRQLQVNAIGPLLMAQKVAPSLSPNAKYAFVTSRMGSIGDESSGGYYGYRMSKAALNMAAVTLAKDLQGSKMMTVVLHPGYVKTDMTNHQGQTSPQDSVSGMLKVISGLTQKDSGSFWDYRGQALPW